MSQLSPEFLARSLSRLNPIVVEHKGRVLVWGGRPVREATASCRTSEVLLFDTDSLRWTLQATGGDPPPAESTADDVAHVLADKLFVIPDLWKVGDYAVHSLDLNDWRWERLRPSGDRPIRCLRYTSWLRGGGGSNIFFFGGLSSLEEAEAAAAAECLRPRCEFERINAVTSADTRPAHIVGVVLNQLVAYDTARNAWWWPRPRRRRSTGSVVVVPSPCCGASSVPVASRVYFFGGLLTESKSFDVVHRLDMNTWEWERLLLAKEDGVVGVLRNAYKWDSTLTLLHNATGRDPAADSVSALLHGPDGCWILRILREQSCGLLQPSTQIRLTRCQYLERYRTSDSGSVAVEGTGQIWIVGGRGREGGLNFLRRVPAACPLPLKHLALKALADGRRTKVYSTIGDWPKTIRDVFHAFVKMEEEEEKIAACVLE